MSSASELREHLAKGSTAELVAVLVTLDAVPVAERADHVKRTIAETVQELAGRYPKVSAALLVWHDDLETEASMAEAAIAGLPAGAIQETPLPE